MDVDAIILSKPYGELQRDVYYRVIEEGRDWWLTANGYYVPKQFCMPRYKRKVKR
jgi:hypothetical protein